MSPVWEYQKATSWEEAVELRAAWGEDGTILAGGQSLVPMLNLRLVAPGGLIDINPIPALDPAVHDGNLVLPALTRQRDLLRSPLIREHCPLLAEVTRHIGNVRVRARGTLGGSLCHADPTGELPCAVLALRGRLVARSPRGERTIDADDFFHTYLTTDLADDELLTEVRLPVLAPRQGWAFHEMVRRYSDFATVAVAATVTLAADGRTVETARVVLGGVADRALALGEHVLAPAIGGAGAEGDLRAVAAAAAESVSPESDVHASAAYRRRLTEVLGYRTLAEAVARARHGEGGGHR